MRLLLVEDELELAQGLQAALRPQFIVDIASSCGEAEYLFEIGEYALVILDAWLGDGTGWELCQSWRKNHSIVPILFLTGAQTTADIIRGFKAGADDYVSKPFQLTELQARLQALLRRSSLLRPTKVQQGELLLDVSTYHASYKNQPLKLRRKEWQILELLLRHPGQVVTYPLFWQHIWERDDEVNSNTLEVHLSQLRRKLAKYCPEPLIETVKPLGYRLVRQ